jgi:hypothetical protein
MSPLVNGDRIMNNLGSNCSRGERRRFKELGTKKLSF